MKGTVEIQNLKCGGCEATILKKLTAQVGVQHVTVDVENGTVSLVYDDPETMNRVENALAKLGYPLVGEQNSLGTRAKSYVSCAVGRIGKSSHDR